MHKSNARATPNQAPAADNRSARKRRTRSGRGDHTDQPARGIASTAGTKGARRRKNGK
jgi:hypothetical protein